MRRPDLTFATVDHNVPTSANRHLPIADPLARQQVETLRSNASTFGVPLFDFDSGRQGIVHVIGPELGLTLPGTTIVCGDSHTSTHGAFGALAFGIGTSEVEHVLATQCLVQAQAEGDARHADGHAEPGRDREGCRARADAAASASAAARATRSSSPGRSIAGAVDGTAHDDLQHEHRSRRAQRADRARRDDVRVPRGPAACAEGHGLDRGGRALEGARRAIATRTFDAEIISM